MTKLEELAKTKHNTNSSNSKLIQSNLEKLFFNIHNKSRLSN